MRQTAMLIALFGAGLGLVGALTALFVGSVGLVSGGGDEAANHTLRAAGGLAASLAAAGSGIGALAKPRLAALLLAAAAIGGLAATLYFLPGAVMLLAAASVAARADREPRP